MKLFKLLWVKSFEKKKINKTIKFREDLKSLFSSILSQKMNINFRVLSFGIIVCGTLIKLCSFYWIYAVLSCFIVAILTFLSVVSSSSSEEQSSDILNNPLEQQIKVKLGLNCKKTLKANHYGNFITFF